MRSIGIGPSQRHREADATEVGRTASGSRDRLVLSLKQGETNAHFVQCAGSADSRIPMPSDTADGRAPSPRSDGSHDPPVGNDPAEGRSTDSDDEVRSRPCRAGRTLTRVGQPLDGEGDGDDNLEDVPKKRACVPRLK